MLVLGGCVENHAPPFANLPYEPFSRTDADLGSYPFQRDGRWGVAIVAKGTDVARLEAAITEATAMIAAQGVAPIQGEP